MGQIFQKHDQRTLDHDLLLNMKRITMREIFDTVDTIHRYYPKQPYINFTQFDDIFSTLTDRYAQIFQHLAEKFTVAVDEDSESEQLLLVNTFEALACFCIFSGESYETKCQFIFRLFDFDCSNTLEKDEIIRTLQCVIRSICKLINLNLPSQKMLQRLGEICFKMMDQDKNKHIDYLEFYNWSIENSELQEFMLKYSGTQTYGYAKKRMSEMMIQSENKFKSLAQKYTNTNTLVPALELQKYLPDMFPDIQSQFKEVLFTLIVDYTLRMKTLGQDESSKYQKDLWEWRSDQQKAQKILNDLFIKRLDFMDIMKAWNAYSTVDINNDSNISIKELKLLIWIYEDEEPDYFRINFEMTQIDTDKSQTINRSEWLIYLCSEDSMIKRQLYNSLIKKMFDKYDEDQDGIVSKDCTTDLLKDIFKEQLKKLKDMRSIDNFHTIIDSLVEDLNKELKIQNFDQFNWLQFHTFLSEATAKYANLSKLLALGN